MLILVQKIKIHKFFFDLVIIEFVSTCMKNNILYDSYSFNIQPLFNYFLHSLLISVNYTDIDSR